MYEESYREKNGLSESQLNETQQTLHFIAENMKMQKKISKEGYSHFQQAIKALEEPKTGHWIPVNDFFINRDGQFIYKFICSECKALSYFRKSNKKAIGANVCPNCGCRMESEVSE